MIETSGARSGGASGTVSATSARLAACVSLRDDRIHVAAAGADLLHVPERLLVGGLSRREDHDREVLVDERDRAVLHLAGRVALGVDVRDLLQLERALERDRVLAAAAEEEHVARGGAALRDRHSAASWRIICSIQEEVAQRLEVPARRVGGERAAQAAELHGEEVEPGELGRERLRRGDADLRSGAREERAAVALARMAEPTTLQIA